MKNHFLKLCFCAFLALQVGFAYGQSTITGAVTDAKDHTSLPGVSVVVKGSMIGVSTDMDGKYTINAKPDDVLVFSFVGYADKEVTVGNQTTINMLMTSDVSELDEVIVVGYGTVRKSDLTGAVTQVGTKEITRVASANITQAIQGNVSGLWANQNDNSPGASTTMQLRGSNSFTGASPLFIVDGFPLPSSDGIKALSPNDIESISVLKDASSTAIYGARAANGVVLITTKSGKTGKNNLDVTAYMGFKSFANNVEMMNGEQYAALRRDAYANDNVEGGVAPFLAEEQATLNSGRYTDWWKEITGSARTTQSYQLTFTNGTEKTKIMLGANFYSEKGIVNNTDFLRGGLRTNISHKMGNLTITSNSSLSITNGQGTTGESVLYPTAVGNPLSPLRDANGKYYTMQVGVSATPLPNPVVYNEQIDNRYTQPMVNSSLSLEYKIMDGLNIKTQLAGEVNNYRLNYYVPIDISANHTESGRNSNGYARIQSNVNYNWMSETTVNYNKLFNNMHNISLLAGFSAQQNRNESLRAEASGFAFDHYGTYAMKQAFGAAKTPTSALEDWSMLSYFGRAIYTLNDKYILTANFRADGSSRFGKNNKWGLFPSAAVAWKVGEESFIKDMDFFDDLKLRGSFGLSGNADALKPYQTMAQMAKGSYNWGGAEGIGYYPSTIAAPNLKWETTRQLDIGLDVSIFNRRLNFAFDYYYKTTYDMIRELPILAVSGFQKSWANMGELENQGIEFTVNSRNFVNEFKWSTMFTVSHNANKIKSFGDDETTQISTDHWVGMPIDIGKRYMIKADGIWQLGQETEAAKYGQKPGDVRYVDQPDENGNVDGKIDAYDRVFIGRLTPKFYGALSNDFEYKGFDLNVFITYEVGRDIYNGNNYLYLSGDGIYNNRVEMLDRWTPTNPSNKYPRASKNLSNRRNDRTSEFLESADFLKLKSVTLGYTLPQNLSRKIRAEQIRFYVSGTNLLTWTGYSGYDPENGDTENTERLATYPMTRTFAFGLNVKF